MDSNTPIEIVLEMASLVTNPDEAPEPIGMAEDAFTRAAQA
jgi:hypothetical protein